MRAIYLLFFVLFTTVVSAKRPCEQWWEQTLEDKVSLETFRDWLGNAQAPSRKTFRNYIKERGYTSMLDAACGLCIDYWGIQNEEIAIKYTGLDVTERLVSANCTNGVNVVLGSIESIPFEDGAFELTYGRHILEHLEGFETALDELIRCASKEALVTFFLIPSARTHNTISVGLDNGYPIYHNVYSKWRIERHIENNPKVDHYRWERVGDREEYLHVHIKQS